MDARAWGSALAHVLIILFALTTVLPGRSTGATNAAASSGPGSSFPSLTSSVLGAGPPPSSGVIIPLYTAPGPDWTIVTQAKLAYPDVPFIAIVNPSNGPGSSKDPGYVKGIQDLRAAGVKVLGYVDTAYGGVNISSIETSIDLYRSWYGVNGIFFDDMTNVTGFESYYSTLSSYAKSMGLYTVGNPGVDLSHTYVGMLDLYVVYEGPTLPAFPGRFPVESTASVIYNVSTISQQYVSALSRLSAYVYVTNQGPPNPYNALPSYFESLVHLLSGPPEGR